jgi:hypothetical protein
VTRIYLPLTVTGLAGHLAAGSIPASVDRFVAAEESEEAEYDALAAAAEEATGLLDGPGRRAVVVADVADEDGAVGFDRVVAVHADTEAVDPATRDLPELGWFATQEIEDLIG